MTQAIEVVIFRLHEEEFGVEIAYIREITGVMDMTVINDPEGFIRGVVNLRGQVIVVVNWDRAVLLYAYGRNAQNRPDHFY